MKTLTHHLACVLCVLLAGGCQSQMERPEPEPPQPVEIIDPTAIPATAVVFTDTPSDEEPPLMRLGYYTPDPYSYEAMKQFSPWLTAVSIDIYGVDEEGRINGSDEFGAVELTHQLGLDAYLCISNYNSNESVSDFDPALARAAIIDHRDSFISALIQLAMEQNYEGINIDFESLAMTGDLNDDRLALTEFIRLLAAHTHRAGLKLIISVPAKTEDDPFDSWSYPFDLAELGKHVDFIQYMTYDQHGPWGEPGPISGYDWVRGTLEYATGQVDPQKILIGLPAYGYDWVVDETGQPDPNYAAGSFGWNHVADRTEVEYAMIGWDDAAKTPNVSYTSDGLLHLAWFENTESIRAKMDLISELHLAGLSVWSLGQEDINFWQATESGDDGPQ